MEIITVPSMFETVRKAYKLEPKEFPLIDFKEGDEVIPAESFEQPGTTRFFFIRKFNPNTKGWKEGGYAVRDNSGGLRSFHLDALIKKNVLLEVQIELPTQRKRGRPKIHKENSILDKPKGKRGRPRKNPEDLTPKKEYVSTGRKRGRPKKDPNSLTIKKQHVPTGRKRGRPKKEAI